jgi:hypothetical protein
VPDGFAGVTPSLALTYSSFAGDGPLGIGWDLPIPTIQRTTARGLPRYTTTDELAFAGGELLVALPDATPVAAARLSDGKGTFRYYPVESVDRFGHKLVYEWAADALPVGASAGARAVPLLRRLSWVFVSGKTETLLTKQLTGITVSVRGQTRRRTVLTYQQARRPSCLWRRARSAAAAAARARPTST